MTAPTPPPIERFADGLDHPEGVAFARDGSLWAGGEAGQLYRIEPDGSWAVVGETGGSCLGLAFGRDEALYVCDPGRRAVLRRDRDGSISIYADRAGDRLMVDPNFPVLGPDGSLYVSCSGRWGACDGWIARVGPDGNAAVFATGLDLANGLAIDGDDRYLYVAETRADRVSRLPLTGEGYARPVVDGLDRLPDGLAFAADGTLLITCYASDRIYALVPDGALSILAEDRGSIQLSHPTNCAFGGPAFDELYVACYGLRHIARLRTGHVGRPLRHLRSQVYP